MELPMLKLRDRCCRDVISGMFYRCLDLLLLLEVYMGNGDELRNLDSISWDGHGSSCCGYNWLKGTTGFKTPVGLTEDGYDGPMGVFKGKMRRYVTLY